MAESFPTFEDERGRLLPVELDDVPFAVRRVFVVHGVPAGRPRGDHEVACDELAVLLTGSAEFRVTTGASERVTVLSRSGETVRLRPGEHVVYHLDGPAASIMVLASEPYSAVEESR